MISDTLRLLYITNLPSPYRVAFLNELGKKCDLTVLFERSSASDRDPKWRGAKAENYTEIYCTDRPLGSDKSIGFDLKRRIRAQDFDRLLISGYSSPAVMAAITDCQRRGVPYYMQYDGGFDSRSFLKDRIKGRLLRPAAGHFTSCSIHRDYLISLGIPQERIWIYPFTSLSEEDILTVPPTKKEQSELRAELGITYSRMVLAVGQFIHRKGFDILLHAAAMEQDPDVGFYFVGGEAIGDYQAIQKELGLSTISFIGFQNRSQLRKWYQAADVFVLPTRYDIWGLVINEALANALPTITTTACAAGTELIRNGFNGYLVPPENPNALIQAIDRVLSEPTDQMKINALSSVQNDTVLQMAEEHLNRLSQKT